MSRILVAALAFTLVAQQAQSQSDAPLRSSASLYAGQGSHGFNARVDLEVGSTQARGSSNRLYVEFGGQGITFDNPEFIFENKSYASKSRIISLGAGVGREMQIGSRLSVMPFAGMRAEYIRFTDADLVAGIGDKGLIRYSGGHQVGPEIENAYGDAISFDVGARLGLRLTDRFEVNGSLGFSPIKFDTKTTLFGQYWGESPNPNPYRTERKLMRLEVGLRYLGRKS
ncbi:MAG: hypothetical protein WC700_04545 [Gemmatimonadaceae bacterium]